MTRFLVALLLTATATAAVSAEPVVAPPDVPVLGTPAPAAMPLPIPPPSAPSVGWASLRLIGATAGIVLLLAATLVTFRRLITRRSPGGWLSRFIPETVAEDDRLHLATRRAVGPRESVAVVHVGRERFLIGVAPGSVTLVARLELRGTTASAVETGAEDFATTLASTPHPAEEALRAAVTRSRQRMARLTGGAAPERGGDA